MASSPAVTDEQIKAVASKLGKRSWLKRKAREDARNARLAELEAENAWLRARVAELSACDKTHETTT
jgi:hypothetical protein